jgi:hypothetical protein
VGPGAGAGAVDLTVLDGLSRGAQHTLNKVAGVVLFVVAVPLLLLSSST